MNVKCLIFLCYVITSCQIGETVRPTKTEIEEEILGIWHYLEVIEDGVGKGYTTTEKLLPEIHEKQHVRALDWLKENKEPDTAKNEQYGLSYRRFSMLMKYLMIYPHLKQVHQRLAKASEASSSKFGVDLDLKL